MIEDFRNFKFVSFKERKDNLLFFKKSQNHLWKFRNLKKIRSRFQLELRCVYIYIYNALVKRWSCWRERRWKESCHERVETPRMEKYFCNDRAVKMNAWIILKSEWDREKQRERRGIKIEGRREGGREERNKEWQKKRKRFLFNWKVPI